MKTTKRIESVRVVRRVDDTPDLSYLGEYTSDVAGPHTIDREERGDCERGQYRYFTPTMTPEETGNPESPEADYSRMEAYNRGDWCMTGVYAEARILIAGTVQTVRSGGLWGIESDSEPTYFAEVAAEELSQLADTLKEMGFSARTIKTAMSHVDRTPVDA